MKSVKMRKGKRFAFFIFIFVEKFSMENILDE